MRLLQLLCVHLLSSVFAQKGLVVNKRARQRLSSSELRRTSDNKLTETESSRQRLSSRTRATATARPRRRGGETALTVFEQSSDQFAPLPNFEFKSENDDSERGKTSYDLPVWDNPAVGFRRRRKLGTRPRQEFSTIQRQEISDGYSNRVLQSGRRRTHTGENLQSTDERYFFQEGSHPAFNDQHQASEQPWTIDYDPQKLPAWNEFSESQKLWEDYNAEDSYEPQRLPSQEDFSYSQTINTPSSKDLQYGSISRQKQRQQNKFEQDFQLQRKNYDNLYNSQQELQFKPQEDFQFQPQQDFPFNQYHEFDSSERFTEPNVFDPFLEVQTNPQFLPTPIPEVFYPAETTESNFPQSFGNYFGKTIFSKITSDAGNGYAEEDYRYIQTTEKSVPETTYWTPPVRRRQELQRHTTATTDSSYWYEETTTEYRKPVSRSRSRIRQKQSFQRINHKNEVQTKPIQRRIPRQRVVKRLKSNRPNQDKGLSRNLDPRDQTSNTFQSRLGIADENSSSGSLKNTRRRSRSRLNSAGNHPIALDRPTLSEDPKLSKAIERLNKHIDNKIQQTARPFDIESNRLPSKTGSNRLPPRKAAKPRHSSPSSSLKFPKRNLFPHLPKIKYADPKTATDDIDTNTIDSGRLPKSISYQGGFIPIQEIQPTRPISKPEIKKPDYDVDYERVEIQSSRNGENEGYITVTHETKAPTVYTILEGTETKQLHAVVKTTSLQIVDVNDLTSTEIDGVGIVYAHVITNHPQFGVKEFKFDKIKPTTTQHIVSSSATLDGHMTMLTKTVRSTYYNVETITARITDTPNIDAQASSTTGLEELVKTILASLLGKNILSNNLIKDAAPTPYTKLKTHTRSYLTETSSTKTFEIPITLRGQQVMKTVTNTVTDTITTTDYSVQTVIDYIKPSTPFLPLAPTLHRAVRVIPSLPIINPINIQPVSTTQYLTQSIVKTQTITEDATTSVVITLGGREVQTSFVRPTTQIVTVTSYSTRTLIQPVATQLASPSNNLANIIQNLKFLQNLQQK